MLLLPNLETSNFNPQQSHLSFLTWQYVSEDFNISVENIEHSKSDPFSNYAQGYSVAFVDPYSAITPRKGGSIVNNTVGANQGWLTIENPQKPNY